MRRILVTTGLILLWAAAVAAGVFAEAWWFAEPSVVRGDFASIENHLVRNLREATDDRRLGSAALVLVQGGEIAAEYGFGVANAETRAPVEPDRTLYQLGSVSKAVTAWGVMKLVEENRLGLDEPVVRHLERWRFPGSDTYGGKVTVRQLLSHTAGIDDGQSTRGVLVGEDLPTLEESLEAQGVAVVREPGSTMSYSSSAGYSILQLTIEEVTHRPFADYMRETVLQPLGMTRSSFDLDAIVSEGRAPDLATPFDADLEPRPPRRYTATSAVALYATPRDLARFVVAFTRENPVLGKETLNQMMTPQPGTGGTWGLGQTLYVATDPSGYVAGHSGGSYPATGASVRVNPKTGNGFVLMASGGRGVTNRLVHDWVYWETGTVTNEGRRELVYDRLKGRAPAAIVVGAIVLVLWGVRNRWARRSAEGSRG